MGWMKVTVMTAAPPAMPTCWKRPGAAAALVAIGIGRVFPEKAGLVLLVVVQRLMMIIWDWNWAVVLWGGSRTKSECKCNARSDWREILCGEVWRSSRVWRFGGASVAIGWLSRSGRAPRQIRRAFSASILSGHSFVITFFCLTSQVFALPADHIHVVAVSGLLSSPFSNLNL